MELTAILDFDPGAPGFLLDPYPDPVSYTHLTLPTTERG
jgi:hypothetical protein